MKKEKDACLDTKKKDAYHVLAQIPIHQMHHPRKKKHHKLLYSLVVCLVALIILVTSVTRIVQSDAVTEIHKIDIDTPISPSKLINKIDDQVDVDETPKSPSKLINTKTSFPRPQSCTSEQRKKIMMQLTPDKCHSLYAPYKQKCSLTQATKCPDATWVDSYYVALDRKERKARNKSDDFVAVYVGCNKGYDAVNTLRMGTGNAKYNKEVWHDQLQETYHSVCKQDGTEEFPINKVEVVDGTVHCIEPMPTTFGSLKSSSEKLGWENEFVVSQAAISKSNGEAYFQSVDNVGQENIGLQNCEELKRHDPEGFKENCVKVNVYTLDHYMENIAAVNNNEKKDREQQGTIELLSIDVEGFDFDVLLGGKRTISRTEYLEFEYNWMGSWSEQKLMDAIKMLDDFGFICYWAGQDKLWRIDESCWLDHYDWHVWSNVACANRDLNSIVAKKMEDIFQNTLKEEISY